MKIKSTVVEYEATGAEGGSSGDKKPTVVERNASPEGQADTRGPMPDMPVSESPGLVFQQELDSINSYDIDRTHVGEGYSAGPTHTWDWNENRNRASGWENQDWNESRYDYYFWNWDQYDQGKGGFK